jgi:hypothetical protein
MLDSIPDVAVFDSQINERRLNPSAPFHARLNSQARSMILGA